MRNSLLLIAIASCFGASGCALCCSPFDHDYATYGSRTPRMDQQYGRVGSVFSDPALMGTGNPGDEYYSDEEYMPSTEEQAIESLEPVFEEEPLEF